MKLILVKGATSQTINIFIQNSSSTTGAGLTGLVFNSASLVAYYVRPRAAAVAITLVTQTVTGAYSSGGFVEIDATNMPGWYRLDLPDAVLATGVDHVGVHLKGATNMAPLPLEIQLTNVNLNDGVRGGMTALPNAAAEAAGGLYTRGIGAGQINQPANGRVDVDAIAISASTVAADNVEANIANLDAAVSTRAVAAVLGALADAAADGDPTSTGTAMAYIKQLINILIGTTGIVTFPAEAAPANNVSLAEVIRAIHADVTGLNGAAMRGTDSAALASVCTEARLSELDAATAGKAAAEVDILKEAAVGRRGTAQAGAAGSVTLDTGASATNDVYKDNWVFLVGGTGASQARLITAYNGTTKVATVVPNWITNPDGTSIFIVLPAARVAGSQATADMRGTDSAALAASFTFTTGNVHAHTKAEDNIDFGVTKKASINTEVDSALDTVIPASPTTNSINERVKAIDDKLPAGNIGDATEANQTTILNRLGAWTGTGVNTVLGACKAVLSKIAALPSDIGGTGDPTTDSLEAIRDTAPIGTAMRGTDNAALASVATEARLSELDAVTAGKMAAEVDLIKTEANKIALADAGAGVTGSVIEEVEKRAIPGSAMALTAAERDSVAAALLDLSGGVEVGLTPRQAMRLLAAATAGKLSGAATTTITIRNAVADSKARITATVDADGNRSAITYDVA